MRAYIRIIARYQTLYYCMYKRKEYTRSPVSMTHVVASNKFVLKIIIFHHISIHVHPIWYTGRLSTRVYIMINVTCKLKTVSDTGSAIRFEMRRG